MVPALPLTVVPAFHHRVLVVTLASRSHPLHGPLFPHIPSTGTGPPSLSMCDALIPSFHPRRPQLSCLTCYSLPQHSRTLLRLLASGRTPPQLVDAFRRTHLASYQHTFTAFVLPNPVQEQAQPGSAGLDIGPVEPGPETNSRHQMRGCRPYQGNSSGSLAHSNP